MHMQFPASIPTVGNKDFLIYFMRNKLGASNIDLQNGPIIIILIDPKTHL